MRTDGLSRMRLGCMHDVMASYVERGEVPGLVTLVSRRGEVHIDATGSDVHRMASSLAWNEHTLVS